MRTTQTSHELTRSATLFRAGGLFPGVLLLLTGCGQNSYTVARQNQTLVAQQQTLAMRNTELQSRASALDQDNRQLESLLAQSRQKVQLLDEQLAAVQDQLKSTNSQLAQARNEKQSLENKTQALAASVQRRPGAKIKANSSLTRDLAVINLPGLQVRQDGDVVRIELPDEKLFYAGSALLRPGAAEFIDSVTADVMRTYPLQRIGIEGHTDSTPIRTAQFPTNLHLSIAKATAVYNELTGRLRVDARQLFVMGHGANLPIASNATDAGRRRNRRVELVIYPETFSR